MSATPLEATASSASPADVRARIERLRLRLVQLRTIRALLFSLTVGVSILFVLRLIGRMLGDRDASEFASSTTVPMLLQGSLPVALAAVVAGLVWWWQLARWDRITLVRAALWYEEHHPSSHAVVTLLDHGCQALSPAIEAQLALAAAMPNTPQVPASAALHRAMWLAWRTPFVSALGAMLALSLVVFMPDGAIARIVNASAVTTGETTTGTPSAIGAWDVEVIPPAYSGLPTRTLRDSGTVEALVGSRIRVSGAGRANDLTAALTAALTSAPTATPTAALTVRGDSARPATTLAIVSTAQGWQSTMMMPSRPAVVRVATADDSRLLVLIPRADSLPLVELSAPLRDSVYRDTVGTITLTAQLRDDLGLSSAAFELILTSGSGERYSAQTITLSPRRFAGQRSGVLTYALSFGQLGVAPGDVIHLRAVARDAHPASAREAGVSETRSLRFARVDEYDSVAVEAAAPPAVDSSLLSQRMVLDLTEKLEARRSRITRELLVAESRQLAAEQARIRRAVSAVVYQRLSGEGQSEHVHYDGDGHDHGVTVQDGKLVPSIGGSTVTVMPGATPPRTNENATDESPIIAVNRPLLEAYNAMWDAGRALELGDPRAAIPPMRLALAAIQRARAAERVYLRGRVRAVVVDLERVRLAGRDTGSASRRTPGEALPDSARIADARLLRAAEALLVDPVAGRDSLVMLRLDAITSAPELSLALAFVLAALTDGRDVSDALVRARRTLVRPVAVQGVSAWSVP